MWSASVREESGADVVQELELDKLLMSTARELIGEWNLGEAFAKYD
jgi:hypothetical protein